MENVLNASIHGKHHNKLMFSYVCMCEFAKCDHKFLSKRKMFIMLLNVLFELTHPPPPLSLSHTLIHLRQKRIYVTYLKLRTVTAKTTTRKHTWTVCSRNNDKPITFYSIFFSLKIGGTSTILWSEIGPAFSWKWASYLYVHIQIHTFRSASTHSCTHARTHT